MKSYLYDTFCIALLFVLTPLDSISARWCVWLHRMRQPHLTPKLVSSDAEEREGENRPRLWVNPQWDDRDAY